jgi:hypothetical protein
LEPRTWTPKRTAQVADGNAEHAERVPLPPRLILAGDAGQDGNAPLPDSPNQGERMAEPASRAALLTPSKTPSRSGSGRAQLWISSNMECASFECKAGGLG